MKINKRRSEIEEILSSKDWTPIYGIKNDVVALKNGEFFTIVEVLPINFKLRSRLEKKSIILNFREFLKACPFPFQVSIMCRKASIEPHIEKMNAHYLTEDNLSAQKMIQGYIGLVKSLGGQGAVTRRFFLVIPFVPSNGVKEISYSDIQKQLTGKKLAISDFLKPCGNIVKISDTHMSNAFLLDILSSAINKDYISKKVGIIHEK